MKISSQSTVWFLLLSCPFLTQCSKTPDTPVTPIRTSSTVENKVWDKAFGGTGNDELRSMVATSDGGFLLGGSSSSGQTGNKSAPNLGFSDYWVVKIDGSGNKVWDKTFGDDGGDDLRSMVATSDGGFLLGGQSGGYWVVKIDGNGNKAWDKTFGGGFAGSNDELYTMIATSDGGFLLGGSSSSGQTGNKSAPNLGFSDYWVVKIDGSGNKVWDKTFGGSDRDILRSMVATLDGGFLLGGRSTSGQTGNKSAPNFGIEDYWVVKINGNGNKVWDRTFGGTRDEFLYSILATSDGGFLLGGYSASGLTGNKSAPNLGDDDMWVVKIDGNGNKTWDKTFGGDSADYLESMIATSDGGFLLGGESISDQIGNKSALNLGYYDMWVAKINGNGNKVWDKTFGGTRDESISSMVATSDGGFLLGGESISGQTGNKSASSWGGYDYWVVKIK